MKDQVSSSKCVRPDSSILLRLKEDYDGAEPSPNSISALNLLRLAEMMGKPEYRQTAENIFIAFSGRLAEAPNAMPQLLVAFDFFRNKPKQIILAGKPGASDTQAMLRAVHMRFIPNKIVLLADGGVGQEILTRHLEFIKAVKPIDGKATAYICENFVCKQPTNDLSTMISLIIESETKQPSKKG